MEHPPPQTNTSLSYPPNSRVELEGTCYRVRAHPHHAVHVPTSTSHLLRLGRPVRPQSMDGRTWHIRSTRTAAAQSLQGGRQTWDDKVWMCGGWSLADGSRLWAVSPPGCGRNAHSLRLWAEYPPNHILTAPLAAARALQRAPRLASAALWPERRPPPCRKGGGGGGGTSCLSCVLARATTSSLQEGGMEEEEGAHLASAAPWPEQPPPLCGREKGD